jgi:hypothetical protein
VFETGLGFTSIIGFHLGKFVGSVDGFVVEDAVEFKGEFQGRDEDVEFTIDGVSAVEVEFEGGIEDRELLLKPSFEFGNTGAFGFMGIVVFSGTRLTAKVVLGLFDLCGCL